MSFIINRKLAGRKMVLNLWPVYSESTEVGGTNCASYVKGIIPTMQIAI